MDAARAHDESAIRRRRSRSVLIPRRWYQVGEDAFPHRADDGGNKARSPGRLRRKPLKPFAQGVPGETGVTVVTTLVCSFCFACEAAGASCARHSLRPPIQGDADFQINPGAWSAAGTGRRAAASPS
jgi:hypothetical protein